MSHLRIVIFPTVDDNKVRTTVRRTKVQIGRVVIKPLLFGKENLLKLLDCI